MCDATRLRDYTRWLMIGRDQCQSFDDIRPKGVGIKIIMAGKKNQRACVFISRRLGGRYPVLNPLFKLERKCMRGLVIQRGGQCAEVTLAWESNIHDRMHKMFDIDNEGEGTCTCLCTRGLACTWGCRDVMLYCYGVFSRWLIKFFIYVLGKRNSFEIRSHVGNTVFNS